MGFKAGGSLWLRLGSKWRYQCKSDKYDVNITVFCLFI